MSTPVRVLFLADSHLGHDLPRHPRVFRRRRGPDFLANHAAALRPALAGDVDLVVHGGDVFDMPRVAPDLARLAYDPLLRVADRGIPVFIVPGNHERARLPHARFLAHPHVHVFDVPRTYVADVRGTRIGLSGFPYERRRVRHEFPRLLERTGWRAAAADVRLLCVHHCVEGATVGPGDYTFTTADDVIRCRDLPSEFAAVLSGHIHRHQVLTADLTGAPLRTPVFYPGSVERTSSAEANETKGYLTLEFSVAALTWSFRELPARPMLLHRLRACDPEELDRQLRLLVVRAPANAVLRVRVEGELAAAHLQVMSAAHVRSYAPVTMNVDVRAADMAHYSPRARRTDRHPAAREENLQLEL